MYDSGGHLTTATDQAGGVRHYTYNARGLPITLADERGKLWTAAYDTDWNLASITNPEGAVTAIGRNSSGHVTAVARAFGTAFERVTSVGYDS